MYLSRAQYLVIYQLNTIFIAILSIIAAQVITSIKKYEIVGRVGAGTDNGRFMLYICLCDKLWVNHIHHVVK